MKKIVYLSGGIGGAKLAKGFYHSNDIDLTIIINTGDDEVIHGVPLSPDIDSVMYALAGIEGEMGWGISNDTFSVSEEYKKFIPQNFSIGDKDLALNLYRNQLLSEGKSLTEITKVFAEHLNLECNLIPMTDDIVSTKLKTDDGSLLDFQEYFVEQQAKPKLTEVVYNGAENAKVSDKLIKKRVKAGVAGRVKESNSPRSESTGQPYMEAEATMRQSIADVKRDKVYCEKRVLLKPDNITVAFYSPYLGTNEQIKSYAQHFWLRSPHYEQDK